MNLINNSQFFESDLETENYSNFVRESLVQSGRGSSQLGTCHFGVQSVRLVQNSVQFDFKIV